MNDEYLLLTGALKVFHDFSITHCEHFFIEHDVANIEFELLRKKYSIQEIATNENDFSKALNIMKWVNHNVLHYGGGGEVDVKKNSLSIL